MPLRGWTLLGMIGLGLVWGGTARGQVPDSPPDTIRPWFKDAWTHVIEKDGVRIAYIYYPEADDENDGIVLRLTNTNDETVWYAFTIIFRAATADTSMEVGGRLGAGQMKTGDRAGLFWIPFKGQDRRLGEIGLRGLEIWREHEREARPSDSTYENGVNASWRPTRGLGGAKPSVSRAVDLYDVAGPHRGRTSSFVEQASVSP